MSLGTFNAHVSSNALSGTAGAWATVRALTDATSAGAPPIIYIGGELSGGVYFTYRTFLQFDTSSLGNGAIINSGTIQIYVDQKDTTNDFTAVTQGHTAANGTLVLADNDSLTVDSPTEYSSRSANVSTIGTGAYLGFALNASGLGAINGTSYTKIALRSSKDVDNSTPTARSYLGFQTQGEASSPQLIVNYAPSGGNLDLTSKIW